MPSFKYLNGTNTIGTGTYKFKYLNPVVSGYTVTFSYTVYVSSDTIRISVDNGQTWDYTMTGEQTITIENVSQIMVAVVCDYGYEYETLAINGTVYAKTQFNKVNFPITQDTTIVYETDACFVKGTKITLADYSTKNVEDVTYNDLILTYDFDNNKFSSAKPCWIAKQKKAPCYWKQTFSDGAILKTVGANNKSHRLFNYSQQKFIYPQDWANKDTAFKQDSTTPYLISNEKIYEEVEYYNFTTYNNLNNFANGILCGNRFTNIYPIKNMKYVKQDIKNYDYETYYKEIPHELFKGLRLSEQSLTTDNSSVKYFSTTKEHVLHNYVEHELNYKGNSDYKIWQYKEKQK